MKLCKYLKFRALIWEDENLENLIKVTLEISILRLS